MERIRFIVQYQATNEASPADYQWRDAAKVEGSMDPGTVTRANGAGRLAAALDAAVKMAGKAWTAGPAARATITSEDVIAAVLGSDDVEAADVD